MFGFLRGLYNGFFGVLSDAEKWIVGAINAVYSFFNGLIDKVWQGIQSLAHAVQGIVDTIWQQLVSLYHLIRWVIDVGIPELARWAQNELNKVRDFINRVLDWIGSQLTKLGNWVLSELNKLAQWIITHVWDPLWNLIQDVKRWIETNGVYVYYLLTHPDKLAALLGKWLLANIVSLGIRSSKPFISWLLHNMISESSLVGRTLEDIISSLF